MVGKFIPLLGERPAAQFAHRLRPVDTPVHTAAFHTVFHPMATRPFDYPGGDRITLGPVVIVAQALLVVGEIAAHRLHPLALADIEITRLGLVTKPYDQVINAPVQHRVKSFMASSS
jgi:hypothetical protein